MAFEKRVLEGALTSGDAKLVALAREWLRDTGQAVPAVVASRVIATAATPPPNPPTDAPAGKPRYLRGAR